MKCIECGHELKDGAVFCIRCGAMQVSMDGSPLEKREWPEVEPQDTGRAYRSSTDTAYEAASTQRTRDFKTAPNRNGGRVVIGIVIVLALIALIAFAVSKCMGPEVSGAGVSSATTSTESSATSDESATSSASSEAASSTSSASSESSSSESSASTSTSTSTSQAPSQSTSESTSQSQSQSESQSTGGSTSNSTSTQTNNAPAPSAGDYVLSESSTRVYTEAELNKLSASELYYARNEIFARHGRLFANSDLQNYFNSKSWYNGTITPEEWNKMGNQLNDVEVKNANLMKKVEEAKGSLYL